MPTVKRWADDLRAVFGAAEFDAGLKSQGFMASEGGRTIDTRKALGACLVVASVPVIRPRAVPATRGARGR